MFLWNRGERITLCECLSVLVPCSLFPVPCLVAAERLRNGPCTVCSTSQSWRIVEVPIQVHGFYCIPRSRQLGGKPGIQDWCPVRTISWGMGERKKEVQSNLLCRSVTHCMVLQLELSTVLPGRYTLVYTATHTVQKGSWSMQRSSLDNCSH